MVLLIRIVQVNFAWQFIQSKILFGGYMVYETMCWEDTFNLGKKIGYEDYFFGEGVCLIEWSKLIEELIPSDAATVLIEKDLEKGLDYRKVTVEGL